MLSTTRMSTRGQVVIPEEIRKQLNLKEGTQFVVVGDRGVVILKAISEPPLEEFDGMIKKARTQAKLAVMKRADVLAAVEKKRGRS